MSGIFGDRSNGALEPALGSLRIQTSMVGLARPLVYGRNRIPGNVLAYYDLRSVTQEASTEAGKGGGASPASSSYTYTATVMMALGEGVIGGIRTVWIGKEAYRDLAQSTRTIAAPPEDFLVPGSPYQVTLSQGASTAAIQQVSAISTDWTDVGPSTFANLREGPDYTRSGGVLTFASAWAGVTVRIEYSYIVATDASSALGRVGLTLKGGALGQPSWSYLDTAYPLQAIGYSGLAYVYAQGYALDSSAQVPNHSFEVEGKFQWSASWPDASPADVVRDLLTNPLYGVDFPNAHIDWSTTYDLFRTYCAATAFFVSPAYTQQRPARDVLGELIEAANADACWRGDRLAIIPRGDQGLTNFGETYAPDVTPVAALTPDDVVGDIEVERPDVADLPTRLVAQISNRDRDYNTEVVTVDDDAAIALHGLRTGDTYSWEFVCKADIAQMALRTRIQRVQAAMPTYRFPIPWRFLQVELGDLLSLTDPLLPLAGEIVKVREMVEESDDVYTVTAEAFPIGHASAPLLAPQVGAGFRPEYNADPGNVTAPVFLEPPGGWTGNGLEVWVAASGSSANWGGCDVYVSMDGGASYKIMGRIDQPCRYGALTAQLQPGSGGALSVQLAGRGGELKSVASAAMQALATLCFVGNVADGEWLTFGAANLTGANAYTLAGLTRGRFGSTDRTHAVGESFVFADGAVAESGPLPEAMIGRTLHFKFASYNIFGAALQSLAEVPAYSYTPTGRFIREGGRDFDNAIQNSSFALGYSGWSITNSSGGAAQAYWAGSGNIAKGVPSDQTIWTFPGAEDAVVTHDSPLACRPGQRVQAFAGIFARNVGVRAQLAFYSAGGVLLQTFAGNLVAPPLAGSASDVLWNQFYAGAADPYSTSFVVAVAPANAAFARLQLYASGAGVESLLASGAFSYFALTKPFIGQADSEQHSPSTWQASPYANSYAYYEASGTNSISVQVAIAAVVEATYVVEGAITAGTYLDGSLQVQTITNPGPAVYNAQRRAITRVSGTATGRVEIRETVRLIPGGKIVLTPSIVSDAGTGASLTVQKLSAVVNGV